MSIIKSSEIKNISKKITEKVFWIIFISIFFVSSAKAAVSFDPPSTFPNINALVEAITNWFLNITAAVSILFLIIGGIYYITAFGDDKKMEVGKKIITYTIYGLIIVLVSYSIILTVNNIIFG